jgi:hypothetical protein
MILKISFIYHCQKRLIYIVFYDLNIYLQALQNSNDADQWKYIWENGQYSSSKAYKSMIGSRPIHPAFKWIWYSACQQKYKIFIGSLLKNSLNTRGLLKRKNMQLDSYDCELCILQMEERLRHLCFKCSFVRNCWMQIGVNVPTWLKPARATRHIKIFLRVPFAIEIIIITCWCIWTERNDWLFNNSHPRVINCKEKFKKEFDLVIHRSKVVEFQT